MIMQRYPVMLLHQKLEIMLQSGKIIRLFNTIMVKP
jgi:hypothetical protein